VPEKKVYSTLSIAHVGSFSAKVSMSVALSTAKPSNHGNRGVDHASDRLSELARGAELLAKTHHHKAVDHAGPG
jgi:hypothetical protein